MRQVTKTERELVILLMENGCALKQRDALHMARKIMRVILPKPKRIALYLKDVERECAKLTRDELTEKCVLLEHALIINT